MGDGDACGSLCECSSRIVCTERVDRTIDERHKGGASTRQEVVVIDIHPECPGHPAHLHRRTEATVAAKQYVPVRPDRVDEIVLIIPIEIRGSTNRCTASDANRGRRLRKPLPGPVFDRRWLQAISFRLIRALLDLHEARETRQRRCGITEDMRGKIRWRYDDPTAAPGPVSPAPADLWAPPPGAVPVAGNVFYVEGEPGEFITDGEVYLITSALFQGGTGFDTYYVGAQQPGDMTWSIHLDSMNSIPRLEVGYYTNTQPTGSGNPSRGRMTISGRGLTCGQYGQGWFAIDDVTYDGEQMSSIDVRFEYRCGDDQPALRGKVRWSQ